MKDIPLEILLSKLSLAGLDVENTQISKEKIPPEIFANGLRTTIHDKLKKLIKEDLDEYLVKISTEEGRSEATKSSSQKEQLIEKYLESLPVEECSLLSDWLDRLGRTFPRKVQERESSFNHGRSLPQVIVDSTLDLINPEKKEFSEPGFLCLRENNTDCSDRTAMAFNQLYVSWKLLNVDKEMKDKAKYEILRRAGNTAAFQKAFYEQLREISKKSSEDYVEDERKVELLLYYQNEVSRQGEARSLPCKLLSFMGIKNVEFADTVGINLDNLRVAVEESGWAETLELFAVEELVKKVKATEWNAIVKESENRLSELGEEIEEKLSELRDKKLSEPEEKKEEFKIFKEHKEKANIIKGNRKDEQQKLKSDWLQSLSGGSEKIPADDHGDYKFDHQRPLSEN